MFTWQIVIYPEKGLYKMIRSITGLFLLSTFALSLSFAEEADGKDPSTVSPLPPNRVSADGRHFETRGGDPFFWLGDTAWELFHRLNREEVDLYLTERARAGFTVIQASVVPMWLIDKPNAYGDFAFVEEDLRRPGITPGADPGNPAEYDFWDHADFIIDTAAAKGLYVALLPIFIAGDAGQSPFSILTADTAPPYGRFLGERYRDRANIFWVLGGDRNPEQETERKIWNEVAKSLTEAVAGEEDYSRTMMTYHINTPRSSSLWFHTAPWLDFNMLQTWNHLDLIQPMIAADRALTPPKPTGLAEAAYEDGPQYGFPITPHRIRQQAYWAFLSGGYHTYGHTSVWNYNNNPEATIPWREALQSGGVKGLSVMKTFLLEQDYWKYNPDPSVLDEKTLADGWAAAMAAKDRSGILVYFGEANSATIALDHLSRDTIEAEWMNPTTGAMQPVKEDLRKGDVPFHPPEGWEDAVLLLKAED